MAKVLVVDDDSHFRGIIERIIRRSSTYAVKSVASEEEAWADLLKTPYDLVMLDLYLDGKKSWDTLKRIKALPSDPIVIMISCEDLAENAEYARGLGAADFIPKPIEFGRLKSSVDAALERRKQARPSRRAGDDAARGESPEVLGLLVFGSRETGFSTETALPSSRFRVFETEDPGRAAEMVSTEKLNAVVAWIDRDVRPTADLIAMLRPEKPGILRLPVLALTDADRDSILGAFKAGADDYLSRPVDARILAAKIEAHARLRREHDLKVKEATAKTLMDAITGLYTRDHVRARLEEEVQRSLRYRRNLALAVLKVSGYVVKNGPGEWDRILFEASRVLREALRISDVVGRWGDDSFAILLPEATADRICSRTEGIRERVEQRISDFRGRTAEVPCHVGLASLPQRPGEGMAREIPVGADGFLGMVHAALARAELFPGGRLEIFGPRFSPDMRTDK